MKSLKKDFLIFKNNPGLVYLDSAATSQKPQAVLDAVSEFYSSYNANIHRGIYPIAEKASAKVEEVRKKVAGFINAKDPSEIIFTKGTTESINLIAYSLGSIAVSDSDEIIATIMEHHANFVPWQELAKRKHAAFKVWDFNEDLDFPFDSLLDFAQTKILAITSVSNVLGVINPISEIVKKAKSINPAITIVVDAAQEVPHREVDVQELGCDFLVFSGHKMLAESGVGVLYGKKKLLEAMPPFLFGGDMIREVTIENTTYADLPNKFEAGTLNIAGIISLGAAIDYLESVSMEKVRRHEEQLTAYCLGQMKAINGLTILGTLDAEVRSGLVSFTIDGIHPHDIAQVLADNNICVRSGHHCTMPLHKRLGIPASVRASFYVYNDEEDIDKLVKGLKQAIKLFR